MLSHPKAPSEEGASVMHWCFPAFAYWASTTRGCFVIAVRGDRDAGMPSASVLSTVTRHLCLGDDFFPYVVLVQPLVAWAIRRTQVGFAHAVYVNALLGQRPFACVVKERGSVACQKFKLA